MRLDKYICESTTMTRSQAKKVIIQGRITSDGTVMRNTGYKVLENTPICFDGNLINVRGTRYIMLNKPKDFICSTVDEQFPSIINLIKVDKPDQLCIAGRLDADTTGLALITDDGQWSHKITSPRRNCSKRYRATLAQPVEQNAVTLFKEGIQLKSENVPCLPATLEILTDNEVLLTIHEGKYHQVKRMFAAIGNLVVELHREQIGEIKLDTDLKLGEWRYLTTDEVNSVK
ncbi:ribosomal small subunit pseudouridine synthase A [Psychromonas ingrahamii 37]|uniref:Ribosomal small subunit pseudouridine synthase A n=1 Tax=Psychromonas ingrahamii (strain DSM 17664 / CCUG 51855 / 37) TaxID=357804 RepID=A1T0E5_PSYIN|nr:16S rRNA pseudouridine(516) synthase RsuA [Psychromonas ingrahamii]ABM05210.1 ribosomal small subunit pseudouridine synthase A [Psychromonas ingrahamii 37]